MFTRNPGQKSSQCSRQTVARGSSTRGGPSNRGGSSTRGGTSNRGGSSNSVSGAAGTRPPYQIGWHKLSELKAKENAADVALYLVGNKQPVMNLLKGNFDKKPDLVILVLEVWMKACLGQSTGHCSLECLTMMVDSEFLSKAVVGYLAKMKATGDAGQNSINVMMAICGVLLTRIPSVSHKDVFLVVGVIDTVVKSERHPPSPLMIEKLHELQKHVHEIVRNNLPTPSTGGAMRRWHSVPNNDLETPPDDYRAISLFPQPRDLAFDAEPFLRRNIAKGRFVDVDHYLDVNFRLLREDFIRPLREGIEEYKKPIRTGKLQNIRVYSDVRIVMPPTCTLSGLEHTLRFNVEKLKGVRWESSKRLIYGSLLCLSRDNFERVLFCTVVGRDLKKLRSDGDIRVRFENFDEDVQDVVDYTYVMVETTAYFEASRHVLRGLQWFTERNMPFAEHIVHCQPKVEAPTYLTRETNYDLSSIVGGNRRQTMRPLRQETWLSSEALRMDDSQRAALMLALSKRLAIIQGPPGTGKTYVGLALVRILIDNWQRWNENSQPILLVCYTNHALDQFLEEITKFLLDKSDSIVRIGGRSANEAMQPFLLKNIKAKLRKDKKLPRDMFNGVTAARRDIGAMEDEIKALSAKIANLDGGIVSVEILRPFMNPTLNAQLNDDMLIKWLCEIDRNVKKEQHPGIQWLVFGEMEPSKQDFIRQRLRLLKTNDVMMNSRLEVDRIQDVWLLNLEQRWYLYNYLVKECVIKELQRTVGDTEALRTTYALRMKRNVMSAESLGAAMNANMSAELDTDDRLVQWLCMEDADSSEDDEGLDFDDEAIIAEQQRMLDNDFDGEDDFAHVRKNSKPTMSNILATTGDIARRSKEPAATDGWQTVTRSKKATKKFVKEQLRSKDLMSADEVMRVRNVWELSIDDRWRLYRYWVNLNVKNHLRGIAEKQALYEEKCKLYREIQDQIDVSILRGVKIIGMTTTAAARLQLLLRDIHPIVTIVEEAAEVLESHIITSLTKNCEHLVLIGDHKQLKPSTTVYELSKNYNLDISFFERMIDNQVEYKCLQYQHRMRPLIATLMKHIYPELKNDRSVTMYDHVKGMGKDMFFVTHNEPEGTETEIKSHYNLFEAEYVAKLCGYLLKQGYEKEQITVLTPYSGQMFQLKKKMPKKEFGGMRLTLVDNFQGEENDIIVLSLVRSEPSDRIGFLAIENRVCVALSRAKLGLYVIGNLKHLSKRSPLWEKICTDLKREEACGPSLEIFCQNHPHNEHSLINKPSDFDRFPQGCCTLPCTTRLTCGHTCSRTCHLDDIQHSLFKCKKPCTKVICSEGHKCPLLCWEKCPPCPTLVAKKLPCGHSRQNVACNQKLTELMCIEMCTRTNKCEHETKCQKRCNEPCWCSEPVPKWLPCQHIKLIPCSRNTEPIVCDKACSRKLPCGHACTKPCKISCGDCMTQVEHRLACRHVQMASCHMRGKAITCNSKCDIPMPCGHICTKQCGEPCGPCEERVKLMLPCDHSIKRVLCKDAATYKQKYRIPVTRKLECGHTQKEPCWKDAGNIVCEQKCSQILECGHNCQGICGSGCLYGRIHQGCKEKIVQKMFCSHRVRIECAFKNSVECSIYPCTTRCSHGYCSQPCSEPCTKCTKACSLGCEHSKCTRLCWEQCDRIPCDKPCSKRIANCDHPCIGLCGEICPELCAVCDKETLVKMNGEFSADSRFVQIVECGHVVEVNRLDSSIESRANDGKLSFPECPICRVTFHQNGRYARLLQSCREYHDREKKSMRPTEEEAKAMKEEFVACYRKLHADPLSKIDRLRLDLEIDNIRGNKLNSVQLAALGMLKKYGDELASLTIPPLSRPDSQSRLCDIVSSIRKAIVSTKFIAVTKQQLNDIVTEMRWLNLLRDTKGRFSNRKAPGTLERIEDALLARKKLDERDNVKIKAMIRLLESTV